MKKILVAIDFSSAAENAARYAVQLSENFKGVEIILYNAYGKLKSEDDGEGSEKYIIIARLREIGQKISGKPNLFYIAESGAFISGIEKYASANNIDLIVVGNNSDTNSKDLSESKISNLMRKLNIPVMIIPSGSKFK